MFKDINPILDSITPSGSSSEILKEGGFIVYFLMIQRFVYHLYLWSEFLNFLRFNQQSV